MKGEITFTEAIRQMFDEPEYYKRMRLPSMESELEGFEKYCIPRMDMHVASIIESVENFHCVKDNYHWRSERLLYCLRFLEENRKVSFRAKISRALVRFLERYTERGFSISDVLKSQRVSQESADSFLIAGKFRRK